MGDADRARRIRGHVAAWAPAAVFAGLIFFGSSRAWSVPTEGATHVLLAKSVHVLEYGLLCALVRRALVRTGSLERRASMIAFVATVAYGATDELHQRLTPGRTPSPLDLLPDAIGAAAALAAIYAVGKKRTEQT